MNQNGHLEQHPEADLLTAFVEHTLSDAEHRRILTHLATCAHCREIIYLSQSANPDAVSLNPSPTSTRPSLGAQLRHWRLLVVAAPALAAVLLFALFLPKHQPSTPQPVLDAKLTAPPAASLASSAPPEPKALKSVAAQESKQRSMPHHLPPRKEESLALATPVGFVVPESKPQAVTATGGVFGTLATEPSDKAQISTASAPTITAGASNSLRRTPSAQAAAQSTARPQAQMTQQSVAAAAPVQIYTATGAASDVTVQAEAAPIIDTNRIGNITRQSIQLPNGQSAVSTALAPPRMVALDAAGNLFFSSNSGSTWQSITAQWTGHAVSVRLRQSAVARAPGGGGLGGALSGSAQAIGAASGAAKTAATTPPLSLSPFELVTDDGKVWSSPDGSLWQSR